MLRPMQTFPAVQVAALDLDETDRGWPLSGERWAVHHPGRREVVVLDRQLEPTWRAGLPSAWGDVCAVAEDLSLVACSRGLQVRLFDATGGQVARLHLPSRETPRWDANCVFARGTRHLWAHAFIDGRDELWLIDLAALEVVDHRRLDTWAVGLTPFHHPDGQTIGLDLPEGQDGCAIRWVRPAGGRIQLRCAPGFDRVLADLHPSGQEYLTTPHPMGDDELVRHRFDDDHGIDRLPAAVALPVTDEWGATPDGWHDCAGYLTDELILAGVQSDFDEWHALVRRSPMSVLGRVAYDPPWWPGWFEPPQAGTWVTTLGRRMQRWELAEYPSERFGTQLSLLDDT